MVALEKQFSKWGILAISIGSILGTGLFFGPAIGARYAGNASLISWLILGAVSVYISACFGELVSMFPKAGGAYEYSKQTYGRPASFFLGWIIWLVSNITTSLCVVAAVEYLIPLQGFAVTKIFVSILFILILNYISYVGVKASSIMSIFFAGITIAVALAVIVPGLFFIKTENILPIATHPFPMILVACFFMLESFFGWEAVTYLAEETKNPQKVIPKYLVLGGIIVSGICIIIALISLGMFGWQALSTTQTPFIDISRVIYGAIGKDIISIGIFLTLIGSAAAGIISTPRLIFALARDKLFLTQLNKIHPKYRTPYRAIIFQAIVSCIVVIMGIGKYNILLSLLVPLGICMYVPIILSVTILRYKKPENPRPFKVPFAKIGPIIISLFLLAILYFWLKDIRNAFSVLGLGISMIGLGIPIYLLLETYHNPKSIIFFNDMMAYVALATERFYLPKDVQKELIKLLGPIKGKRVLEFGCGVGTLTEQIAEEVTKTGKVFATDISKRELEITRKRLERKGHSHVEVLHEIKDSVHANVHHIDAVVSVSALGYLQDEKKVLIDINRKMKLSGVVCFLDYDKFFHVIPNVEWLSNDKEIKLVFEHCGFSVNIIRKQERFWELIYIHGKKVRDIKKSV